MSKYTVVYDVKIDIICDAKNEEEAYKKSHEELIKKLAPIMKSSNCDGCTITNFGKLYKN